MHEALDKLSDKRGSGGRELTRARHGNNFPISNKAVTAANGTFRESAARQSDVNSRAGYAFRNRINGSASRGEGENKTRVACVRGAAGEISTFLQRGRPLAPSREIRYLVARRLY